MSKPAEKYSYGLSFLFTEMKKKKQTEKTYTELKSEVEYLLHHDCLTGLYNRIYYEEVKTRLDASDEFPLSIIIGDINGLKMINKALGHESGDKLIKSTARIFKSCCRDTDIIGRTGSDEFSILLPGTDIKKAEQITRQITAACEEHNRSIDNELLHINVCIGYATKSVTGIRIDTVERIADEYMCSCKLLQDKSIHSTIVSTIRSTLNDKSQETAEHAERLAVLTRKIGEKLNLTVNELNELELFATLHDIGKISIGDEILNKSGKLSPDEWLKMKRHSEIGYNLAMSAAELKPIACLILSHHENWNGSGYPQGLSGEMIPLASRILSIADSYDAMTQDRVYRKALGKEEALKEIRKNIGLKFDPAVAKVFLQLVEE